MDTWKCYVDDVHVGDYIVRKDAEIITHKLIWVKGRSYDIEKVNRATMRLDGVWA